MIKHFFIVLLSLTVHTTAIAQSHDGKNNKLVEFAHSGSWELWCLKLENDGRIECNLNHVLRYKDHPDFRAMIPRVYWRDNAPVMSWGAELQTGFGRGHIKAADETPLEFPSCGRPCVVPNGWLNQLIALAENNDEVTLRFHDYLVQEFNEPLPLDGFSEGVKLLQQTQTKYDSQ